MNLCLTFTKCAACIQYSMYCKSTLITQSQYRGTVGQGKENARVLCVQDI